MNKFSTTIAAACLGLLCAVPFGAQAQADAGVFQALGDWSANRVQNAPPPLPPASPIALAVTWPGQELPGSAPPATQGQQGMWVPSPQPYAVNPAQVVPYTQAPYYSPAPMIVGQPDIPMASPQTAFDPNRPWDGSANYQGVTVAAVMLDGQNRVRETRSLASGFRSGERFKLRIVSTFDAIVSLDALRAQPGSINAAGVMAAPPVWAGQLYPARPDQVVQVRSGEVLQLPVGANEYFTFEGKTGTELLSLNVRHPQAGNSMLNRQPVYRQDTPGMTSYSQLAQPGAYTALTQILALQHSR